jgi:hypothetical protein
MIASATLKQTEGVGTGGVSSGGVITGGVVSGGVVSGGVGSGGEGIRVVDPGGFFFLAHLQACISPITWIRSVNSSKTSSKGLGSLEHLIFGK